MIFFVVNDLRSDEIQLLTSFVRRFAKTNLSPFESLSFATLQRPLIHQVFHIYNCVVVFSQKITISCPQEKRFVKVGIILEPETDNCSVIRFVLLWLTAAVNLKSLSQVGSASFSFTPTKNSKLPMQQLKSTPLRPQPVFTSVWCLFTTRHYCWQLVWVL